MTNPYKSPVSTPGPSRAGQSARFFARLVFNAAVLVVFTGVVIGCIWLFFHGYTWFVGTSVLLCSTLAAWFAGRSRQERITLSLTVPSITFGGAVGFFTYFKMFSLSWFEAAFNNEWAGPIGMICFVCITGMASGGVTCWCISALWAKLWPAAKTGK